MVKLNKDEFIEKIFTRINNLISDYKLIKENELIAVALSGGKDSVLTLHALKNYQNYLDFDLVAISVGTDNFMADNKVYLKNIPIQLDYTYLAKDIDMQNKIENEVLSDIAWNKSDETYLSDEEVWQVSYFFEI